MKGRVLAVDPGSKRLGIAISDPNWLVVKPLLVIQHLSMDADCDKILELCLQYEIKLILVGKATSTDGGETPQSRHSIKLAETIGRKSAIPVMLWDESESTSIARRNAIETGVSRKKRAGHLDEHAAAVILESYLTAAENGSLDEG